MRKLWLFLGVLVLVLAMSGVWFLGYNIGNKTGETTTDYLMLAVDYERKATEAQAKVNEIWKDYNRIPATTQYKELRDGLETQAEYYADLAQECRQLASKYRDLAAK